MNEKMPSSPNTAEMTPKKEYSGDEQQAQFEKDHPELFEKPVVSKECSPEIAEFDELADVFEAKHSLSELNTIETEEEAMQSALRESAKKYLGPILTKLKLIKEKTNASDEEKARLQARYKLISRAVGMINGGKVDHTR